MSITIIKQDGQIRVLEVDGDIPPDRPVRFFTEEELQTLAARDVWMSLPTETREDMLLQTQSHSYQEWMEEDEWDSCKVREGSGDGLNLADFKA